MKITNTIEEYIDLKKRIDFYLKINLTKKQMVIFAFMKNRLRELQEKLQINLN